MSSTTINRHQITLAKLADIPVTPYLVCTDDGREEYGLLPQSKTHLLQLLNERSFMVDLHQAFYAHDITVLCAKYHLQKQKLAKLNAATYYTLAVYFTNGYDGIMDNFSIALVKHHPVGNLLKDYGWRETMEAVTLPMYRVIDQLTTHQMLLVNNSDTAIDFKINQQVYHLAAWDAFDSACTCIIDVEVGDELDITTDDHLSPIPQKRLIAYFQDQLNQEFHSYDLLKHLTHYQMHYVVQQDMLEPQYMTGKAVQHYVALSDVDYCNLIDDDKIVFHWQFCKQWQFCQNYLNTVYQRDLDVINNHHYYDTHIELSFQTVGDRKQDIWSLHPVMEIRFERIREYEFPTVLDQWLACTIQSMVDYMTAIDLKVQKGEEYLGITFAPCTIKHPQQYVFQYDHQFILMQNKLLAQNRMVQKVLHQVGDVLHLVAKKMQNQL